MEPSSTKKYTLTVMITKGDAECKMINTRNGPTPVKRDIYAEDARGVVNVQLSENKAKELTSKKSYKLTHRVLKKFNKEVYIQSST